MLLMITPGVAASSAHMSRPFGIDSSCASLKFCCTRVAEYRSPANRRVTVTVSCSVATASSAFTLAVKPSDTWTPPRLTVLKPASSNVSS